jgi:hypothetical protein
MKKITTFLVLFCVAFSLRAQQNTSKTQLLGSWEVEFIETAVPSAAISLTFLADGRFRVKVNEDGRKGTWQMTSDNRSVVMRFDNQEIGTTTLEIKELTAQKLVFYESPTNQTTFLKKLPAILPDFEEKEYLKEMENPKDSTEITEGIAELPTDTIIPVQEPTIEFPKPDPKPLPKNAPKILIGKWQLYALGEHKTTKDASIIFQKNGEFIQAEGARKRTGRWNLEANTIYLNPDKAEGSGNKDMMLLISLSAATMIFIDNGYGQQITLKKVKK